MRLDALLRSHGFMRVERPPELWQAATEDTTLIPLLGEMIAWRLALGGKLEELTLNANNVVVREDDFDALADRLSAANAQYAYTRSFDGKGTITVFLARKA